MRRRKDYSGNKFDRPWLDSTQSDHRFCSHDAFLSPGGAGLQACIVVLLFAAAVAQAREDGKDS